MSNNSLPTATANKFRHMFKGAGLQNLIEFYKVLNSGSPDSRIGNFSLITDGNVYRTNGNFANSGINASVRSRRVKSLFVTYHRFIAVLAYLN